MLLRERPTTQVAQVRADPRVHGAQVSAQHLTQQEAAAALTALEAALASVRQHVTRQLTAAGALPRAHVADKLLLLVDRIHVILIPGVRLEHRSTQRALHRSLLPHRRRSGFLLLGRQVMRLLVDKTVHAEVERVLHATAALRALVGLRVIRDVEQQFLVAAETALADRALELLAGDLQKGVLEVDRRRLVLLRWVGLRGLEGAHVVDADVPAELMDCGADFRTLGALERRHVGRLVDQFRVKVQPVGRRALECHLLAAVHDAFVALEARHVSETLTAVVAGLARRHDAVLLG